MANSLKLLSPAKLNLFLHILGQRPDGYHNLQTVFQFIDFCDVLEFQTQPSHDITLISDTDCQTPPEKNLIVRAARLLQTHTRTSQGATITLQKKIPMGAGLGGGSSNAATTLLGLNTLWQLHLPLPELAQLALQLGADVPIFIHGKAAFAESVGEKIHPLVLPEPWYVVLVPQSKIITAKIFSDPELTRDSPPITIDDFLKGQGHNDFEPLVRKRYQDIAATLDWLNPFTKARLTGSGSSVFGSVSNEQQAKKILEQMPSQLSGFIAKGLNISPFWGVAKR